MSQHIKIHTAGQQPQAIFPDFFCSKLKIA